MQARTAVAALVAAATVLTALATHGALAVLHGRSERAAEAQSLRRAAQAITSLEGSERDKLSAALDVILADRELKRAFVQRDRAALLAATKPVFERLRQHGGVTHWYFVEPDRTCFLRVHLPALHGDKIERLTTLLAFRSGDAGAGKDLGATAFALRVVRAWHDADGKLIGFVELAEDIDQVLLRAKRETGDDVALTVSKKFLDETLWRGANGRARDTWNDRPDEVVIDTTSFTEGLVDHQGELESIPEQGAVLERRERSGRSFVRGAFPVRDAGGRRIGAIFVFHDVTDLNATFEEGRRRGLLLALGAGVLLALAAAFVIDRRAFGGASGVGARARVKEPQRSGDPVAPGDPEPQGGNHVSERMLAPGDAQPSAAAPRAGAPRAH